MLLGAKRGSNCEHHLWMGPKRPQFFGRGEPFIRGKFLRGLPSPRSHFLLFFFQGFHLVLSAQTAHDHRLLRHLQEHQHASVRPHGGPGKGNTLISVKLLSNMKFFLFTCGGARRSISGTFSSLENESITASNTEDVQSRDVWNENLQFLRWSAVFYSQLFVYFSQISHLEASDTETPQSKDVWNENV